VFPFLLAVLLTQPQVHGECMAPLPQSRYLLRCLAGIPLLYHTKHSVYGIERVQWIMDGLVLPNISSFQLAGWS
jgi:hypothetical protein